MKLVVCTTDGGALTIDDFEQESIMAMLDEWPNTHTLAFSLDTGMAYIATRNITRIDVIDE